MTSINNYDEDKSKTKKYTGNIFYQCIVLSVFSYQFYRMVNVTTLLKSNNKIDNS